MNWKAFTVENWISLFNLILLLISSIWVLFVYYYDFRREENSYLKLLINSSNDQGIVKIKTSLNNETKKIRKLDFAFLIIINQNKDFEEEVNNNMNVNFQCTNDFRLLKNNDNLINQDFAFISLPYYSKENVRVSNEDLTFSVIFNENNLTNETQDRKFFEVRFYVFPDVDDKLNFHRSVQDTFFTYDKLNKLLLDFN